MQFERTIFDIAFPYDEYNPSLITEPGLILRISRNVPVEFRIPVFPVGRRSFLPGATVLMLEATVNEYSQPMLGKRQIGFAGEFFDVQTVTMTGSLHFAADDHFRFGVSASNAGHYVGPHVRRYSIGHRLPLIPTGAVNLAEGFFNLQFYMNIVGSSARLSFATFALNDYVIADRDLGGTRRETDVAASNQRNDFARHVVDVKTAKYDGIQNQHLRLVVSQQSRDSDFNLGENAPYAVAFLHSHERIVSVHSLFAKYGIRTVWAPYTDHRGSKGRGVSFSLNRTMEVQGWKGICTE